MEERKIYYKQLLLILSGGIIIIFITYMIMSFSTRFKPFPKPISRRYIFELHKFNEYIKQTSFIPPEIKSEMNLTNGFQNNDYLGHYVHDTLIDDFNSRLKLFVYNYYYSDIFKRIPLKLNNQQVLFNYLEVPKLHDNILNHMINTINTNKYTKNNYNLKLFNLKFILFYCLSDKIKDKIINQYPQEKLSIFHNLYKNILYQTQSIDFQTLFLLFPIKYTTTNISTDKKNLLIIPELLEVFKMFCKKFFINNLNFSLILVNTFFKTKDITSFKILMNHIKQSYKSIEFNDRKIMINFTKPIELAINNYNSKDETTKYFLKLFLTNYLKDI